MRQDPDIILVGEMRDHDTAEMAFRAAMTGHQVFTTLHTNSALGAFPRLLDIGIQPDIMAGNIIGVIAQRLVRVLCPHCKEAYAPTPRRAPDPRRRRATIAVTFTGRSAASNATTKATGAACAVMELLVMDADLDELVARRATAKELRAAALAKGFRSARRRRHRARAGRRHQPGRGLARDRPDRAHG